MVPAVIEGATYHLMILKEQERLEMTWGMAGPSMVCKTIRQGFDSLPRLHIEWRHGRRFPQDYTRRRLRDLVLHHCEEHIKAKTEASNLRGRLIEAQKELSRLKRKKLGAPR